MDAGLIPASQPAGGPSQDSGAKANLAPGTKGEEGGFARHLEQSEHSGQAGGDHNLSHPAGQSPIIGSPLSQPSATLSETLMGRMQAGSVVDQIQRAEAAGSDVMDLGTLKGLGAKFEDLDALLQDSPDLAFLAGRLEYVQPQDIPNLVTSSHFIQSALAAEDMGEFMSKPQTLGNLIDQLELPASVKGTLTQLGMDLTQVVTPKKLLATLGLDPGVVGSELQMLKDNMQLEGLSPYMRRAAKLNKQVSDGPAPAPHTAEHRVDLRSERGGPAEPMTSATAMSISQDNEALKSQVHQSRTLSPLQGGLEQTPEAGRRSELSSRNLELAPAAPSAADPMAAPRFERVTTDPTQSMSRTLEQMSAEQKFSFNGQKAASPLSEMDAPPAPANTERNLFADPAVAASMSGELGDASGLLQNQTKQSHATTIERLLASQVIQHSGAVGAEGSEKQAGHQGSGSEQGFGQHAELNPGFEQSRASNLVTTGSQKADFAEIMKQADATPKAVQKEVVEKAQMLLKDGGGQVKMNIGNGEHRVELAMDIKNETVNLKILTQSDQVKDLLANDLPKLREALGQQNLELSEVELGSHSKREWSNGSSDQGAFQKEFAEQQERFVERPGSVMKSSSKSYGSLVAENASMPRSRHTGQIQVFA